MADVFISYSRQDRASVETLASALNARGLDVFWDRDIGAGADFAQTIEREIDAARQVVVVWSESATESQWVRDEAELAQSQGKLVPTSLDGTLGPLGFRQLQTLDLSGWFRQRDAGSLEELVRRIDQMPADRPQIQQAPVAQASLATGRSWVVGAALAFVLAMGWQWWRTSSEAPAPPGAVSRSASVAVAVIPFRSLTPDGSDELFADGLSEELLHRLAAVRGLAVPGRSSAFRFKQSTEKPQSMGRQLDVDYLVEGTVRRSGEALRITASLVEVSSGFTQWSQNFDREMADLFEIQDGIAEAVVSELLGAISYDEVAKASYQSNSPQAHASYLEGRALWRNREQGALTRFERALEQDPEHALAHAYRAIVAAYYEQGPSAAASQSLAKAATLEPDHPDILFAQAWVAEMSGIEDAASLEDNYRQALRANPRHLEALYASFRISGDITLLESALAIDPAHLPVRASLAYRYYVDGNRAAAASSLVQSLTTYPELSPASLGDTAKGFGDFDTFIRLIFSDPARSLADPWSRSVFAATLMELGAVPEARFVVDRGTDHYSLSISAKLREDWEAYREAVSSPQVPPVFRPFALALGFYEVGRYDDALRELTARWPEVFAEQPEFREGRFGSEGDWVALFGIDLLERTGAKNRARALAESLLTKMLEYPDVISWRYDFQSALVHAKLGQLETAVAALSNAREHGFRYPLTYGCDACLWPEISRPDGFLQPILADPRVQDMLDELQRSNAEALQEIERRYGALSHVRALMAEEG
ncbi:MAG: TIR domain-containing protein [Pseudomonadota bacterium]